MNPCDVHLADQLTAAARHARNTIAATATAFGLPANATNEHSWLQEKVNELRATVEAGRGHLCPHIGPAPMLVMAAAWAPGRVTCAHCASVLFNLAPAEDLTCDRCRRQVAELVRGAGSFGPIIFHFGLCPACADATGAPRQLASAFRRPA